MIERNLGNAERIMRLLFGLSMLAWAFNQSAMGSVDWFVVVISVALLLNGLFSRCYLWFVLDINTCRGSGKDCSPQATCP